MIQRAEPHRGGANQRGVRSERGGARDVAVQVAFERQIL
jgi:hypothetical protein